MASSLVLSTILRATQFHSPVLRLFTAQSRLPLLVVPIHVRIQPVEVGEVADRLAGLAAGDRAGRVEDQAGQAIVQFTELAEGHLKVSGQHKRVVAVPIPAGWAEHFGPGAHLAPEYADGHITFQQVPH